MIIDRSSSAFQKQILDTPARKPLVSICLPNLNNRSFLGERLQTIRAQTLTDWELVVVDSHSDDGAWEYFCEVAGTEPRMRLYQAPRGLYTSWNRCVELARGDFVYFATSDDTMAPDCLEKLVMALQRHPDCDVAHCPLRKIDASGVAIAHDWLRRSVFACSSGALFGRAHIRRAPHDGLLHLTGFSVYISITQLLIRRTLFQQIGGFESKWGSVGDINWEMRAGLVANVFHVPDTWGGWRQHSGGATSQLAIGSVDYWDKYEEMVAHALEQAGPYLSSELRHRLDSNWRKWFQENARFAVEMRRRRRGWERVRYAIARFLRGDLRGLYWLNERLTPGRARWTYTALRKFLIIATDPKKSLVPVDLS